MSWDDPEFAGSRARDIRGPALVRFDAIGEAWRLFKERWSVWVPVIVIAIVFNGMLVGLASSIARVPFGAGPPAFRMPFFPRGEMAAFVVAGMINGLIVGALFRLACRQVRGMSIAVTDLLTISDVLAELVLGSVFYTLAVFLAGCCLVFPAFIVSGLLMFLMPLIVDARLPATTAFARSWSVLKEQWLLATVFHIVLMFVSGVGTCLCGCGLLITAPLYTLTVAVLYRDFFLGKTLPPSDKPPPAYSDL